MPKVEYDSECSECEGTGLIIYDPHNIASECGECDGKGWKHVTIEYDSTDYKRKRVGGNIDRVYPTHMCAYHAGDNREAGISYQRWFLGDDRSKWRHSENRQQCPQEEYTDSRFVFGGHYDDIAEKLCKEKKGFHTVGVVGRIPYRCPYYDDRAECWELYDELYSDYWDNPEAMEKLSD